MAEAGAAETNAAPTPIAAARPASARARRSVRRSRTRHWQALLDVSVARQGCTTCGRIVRAHSTRAADSSFHRGVSTALRSRRPANQSGDRAARDAQREVEDGQMREQPDAPAAMGVGPHGARDCDEHPDKHGPASFRRVHPLERAASPPPRPALRAPPAPARRSNPDPPPTPARTPPKYPQQTPVPPDDERPKHAAWNAHAPDRVFCRVGRGSESHADPRSPILGRHRPANFGWPKTARQ